MSVLYYLAVGRLVKEDDKYAEGKHVIIASAPAPSHEGSEKDYRSHIVQIMNKGAAKLAPDKRIRLMVDDSNCDVNVLADKLGDSLLLYFVVARTNLITDKVFSDFKTGFLQINQLDDVERAKDKGSVHKASQDLFARLFETHGTDKLQVVQQKVEVVKQQMQVNVGEAIKNLEDVEKVAASAEELELEAKRFKKVTRQVHTRFRCQHYKVIGLISLVVIIVIIIIIVSSLPKQN